ncbi:monovalent cation/H(+) antiporter subunit G [Streptomyces sp. JJ66]|uniref:monovalent cation/H(+) antiporter subunit G n=1 Tax=Streptomyces sp. JJ66 TaxID=2803843 RepID=UPI001C56168F|nr:monovalent cation/H(+) antiporter subunit G [Streptomyces sp. JJ66]MBW1603968.1 monovalent cation/H(+) antiporter subunit G [Streptomyces sp. JJ66]
MSTVLDVISAVLLLTGALFCLLAALGLLRFPDAVCRLHAAAKAQTLGLLLILLGAALQAPFRYAAPLALVALFQLLTIPVTSQIVGRTAYRTSSLSAPSLTEDALAPRIPPAERRPSAEE